MALQSVIEQFGTRIGMKFSFENGNLTALDISDVGTLYLEISNENGYEELLMYLKREHALHDRDVSRRALEFCHYRHNHPFRIWAGLLKDSLVVLTRFTGSEITGNTLENAAIFLTESARAILGDR